MTCKHGAMLYISFATLLLLKAHGDESGAAAVLDDSCRDSPLSLVQSKAASRKPSAARTPGSLPWEQRFFYVGTHHKSGSNLLRDVMRHAFDDLGAARSCHYNKREVTGNSPSYVTSGDHFSNCNESSDIPIHWDNNAKPADFWLFKDAAARANKPIRAVHAIRKPKDMLVSCYCYHHRGQEYGTFAVAWPEIMSMGPVEGMMALWPAMNLIFDVMVGFYLNTTADEVISVRFEEITRSSEDFDRVVRQLFSFFFAPIVSEEDQMRLWQKAKVEDLNTDINGTHAISRSTHPNDDNCMQATSDALLRLDPSVLNALKDFQQMLDYSTENWPDPVTG